MSVLESKAMYDLKWTYNYNLKRYYNGCAYCSEHKKEIKKWLSELLSILENIEILLEEISKYEEVSEKEILEGFEIETD